MYWHGTGHFSNGNVNYINWFLKNNNNHNNSELTLKPLKINPTLHWLIIFKDLIWIERDRIVPTRQLSHWFHAIYCNVLVTSIFIKSQTIKTVKSRRLILNESIIKNSPKSPKHDSRIQTSEVFKFHLTFWGNKMVVVLKSSFKKKNQLWPYWGPKLYGSIIKKQTTNQTNKKRTTNCQKVIEMDNSNVCNYISWFRNIKGMCLPISPLI